MSCDAYKFAVRDCIFIDEIYANLVIQLSQV